MSLLYSDKLLRQSGLTHKSGTLAFITGAGYILDEKSRAIKLNISDSQFPICSELIGKKVNVSGILYESGKALQVYNIYLND